MAGEIAEYFLSHPYFSILEPDEAEYLAKHCFTTDFKKDDIVFREGDPGNIVYIVKKGNIKIYKSGYLGEIGISLMGAGEIYGEMSIVDGYPRSASARAVTDVQLVGLKQAGLEEIKKDNTAVAAKLLDILLQVLTKRLRATTQKIYGQF
jgi:CRP-like cAMP-binding protein